MGSAPHVDVSSGQDLPARGSNSMQLAGAAAVVAGEAVIGQVVVAGPLGHVDVPGDAQLASPSSVPAAMLIVSRPGASQNKLEPHSPQNPRRAWAASLPAAHLVATAPQRDRPRLVDDGEILATSRRERGDVAVPAPALFAVADQDVPQRSAHLVADRSTKASPGRHRRS